MAATKDQKERFIELRAQGWSFEKISNEVGVSKPTLIKWQKEYQEEIANLEYFSYQSLLEQFKQARRHKVETLLKTLERVQAEVEKRDLGEVSIKDLFQMKAQLERSLHSELLRIQCYTGRNSIAQLFDGDKETMSLTES